jgi:uncharacterized protein (TIRG00374 family)
MTGSSSSVSIPKLRVQLRRYLPLLLLLGLAVNLFLPQITTLEHSLQVIREIAVWGVVMAVIAQVLSRLGNGYLFWAVVALVGQRLSVVRGTLIGMAASSIGLVAGGLIGSTAATYRWVRSSGVNAEGAGLAGGVPTLLNNGALVIMSVFGLLHLLFVHELSTLQATVFSLTLLILGLAVVTMLWGVQHRSHLTKVGLWTSVHWSKLRRQPYDPSTAQASIERLFNTWDTLRTGDWRRPVAGAVLTVAFDMLTLHLIFIAAGHAVSPGILLAGYGLPLLLGRMSILPGGVGIVEGTMTVLYDGLGVPNPITIVVILVYRAISFWLPSLLGFLFVPYLQHTGQQTMS